MRLTWSWAIILIGGLAVPAFAEIPAGGSFTKHRFEAKDPRDSREYWLYEPSGLAAEPVPVVVYLHGCNQTATDAAIGTRWAEAAEARKFLAVFPEQRDPNEEDPLGPERVEGYLFAGNGARCWNWFRPEHIERGAGEAATIAGIVREAMTDHAVDPDRVYVMGASAGGVMAGVMGATYPDLFAAVGILAGCPYPVCIDPTGALAAGAMGEHARPMPFFVVHGTADSLVPYPVGVETVQQWLGTADHTDDGSLNGSVPRLPASTEHHGLDESATDGLGTAGDTCVRPRNFPCAGGAAGFEDSYPYTVDRYDLTESCSLGELWTIHGLGHGYPNGDTDGTFTDPLGPDVTNAAYDFFLAHPHPRAGSCPSETID